MSRVEGRIDMFWKKQKEAMRLPGGVRTPREVSVPREWKRQGTDSPPGPPERHSPSHTEVLAL